MRALERLGIATSVAAPVPWTPWPLPQLAERWRRYASVPAEYRDGAAAVLRPRYLVLPREPHFARPAWQMARAVRRVLPPSLLPDLIHAHFAMPPGGAARHLSGWLGVPYVLTLHGSDVHRWPRLHPSGLPDFRQAIAGAAEVIAVSSDLAAAAHRLTGIPCRVLPIGIDRATFTSAMRPKIEARHHLSLPPDRIVVLYVGNLLPEKGIRELVDAVVDLGDPYAVVLVGRGPLQGYGTERSPLGEGRVSYPGPKTNAEVALYMSAADTLVLPSYSEGLPTVLVEAGVANLPVIASGVGGIPELLGRDRGFQLTEITRKAIADALRRLTLDPAEARARAERLREFIGLHYDADKNAGRLAALYAEVTGRSVE